MSIELIKNKKHIIIKRDGREEEFNPEKLKKVILWATDNSEVLTNKILENINLKINDRMKINHLYDEVINTVVAMISPLYPIYEEVAEKLYLMKIYKETWNLKKTGDYPHLRDFLDAGVKAKVYTPDVFKYFSNKDIDELNKAIKPDRDLNYTYKGLAVMYNKYCKKYKGKKTELPQITYMIASMYSFIEDYYKGSDDNKKKRSKKGRLKNIIRTYNMLSKFEVIFATPRMMNSMSLNPQLASCVLNTVDDDTWSLNQTDGNMAFYSKFAGGIALDVSHIRSSGSKIGASGVSDGPVNFIKRTEQTISSFNQSGVRKGSCVVTFPWWHYDSQDMIMLKDAGGTEDTRARKLVYSVRLDNIFKQRVKARANVTLFDPKETPLLNSTYGKEFEEAYKMYENKSGIRKKTIGALDLLFQLLKVRTETGNLYITFTDNINEQNVRNQYVGASNLCVAGDTYLLHAKGYDKFTDILPGDEDVGELFDITVWDGEGYSPAKIFKTNDNARLFNLFFESSFMLNGKKVVYSSSIWSTEYHRWVLKDNSITTTSELMDNGVKKTLKPFIVTGKQLKQMLGVINPPKINIEKILEDGVYEIASSYKPYKDIASKNGPTYCTHVYSNHQMIVNGVVTKQCQEILVPSTPSKFIERKVYKTLEGKTEIHEVKESGEIGICNLVSINLMSWNKMKATDKEVFCDTLLRGCDNILDTQFYPVSEGEISNKKNRPIGVGVINYAQLLAENNLKFTDEEALEFTNKIFDDLYYYIYKASMKLAKERGAYETFRNDKWARGLTPFHLSKLDDKKLKITSNHEKWDKLAEEIKTYGVRFSLHAACPPTATSGKSVSATESTEPIMDLFYVEEGTLVLPSLAPNIRKLRDKYQRCWEIPAKNIIELAAVRQRYIDQAQSINLYYVKPESATELWEDIEYAMDLGIKTLYYMKTPKAGFELEATCESCT